MGCCFRVIFSIFLMAGVGYTLKSLGFWGQREGEVFSKTVLYITLPCFVFVSLVGGKLTREAFFVVLLLIGGSLLSGGIAFLLARFLNLSPPAMGAFILASAVGNTGFLGYPIIEGLFGKAGLPWGVVIDQFGMALPLNTLGIAISAYFGQSKSKEGKEIRSIIKSPPFIASIIGLFLLGKNFPPFLQPLWRSLELFRDATIPLIMLFIGISIRPSALRKVWAPVLFSSLIKLILLPFIVSALALRLNLSLLPFNVLVIQSAMPTALLTVVFSDNFELDQDLATGAVFISTIASLFTIPFVSKIMGVL